MDLPASERYAMNIHLTDTTRESCPEIIALLEEIDSPANAYVCPWEPRPPRFRVPEDLWREVRVDKAVQAAHGGLDVWCRVGGGEHGSTFFLRRPRWPRLLPNEHDRLLLLCCRYWPEEATRALGIDLDPEGRPQDNDKLARVLACPNAEVRLLGLRLLGAVAR
jgi:hypothetical protein